MSTAGTAKFRLYFEKRPEFTVTYSDKEDLYESFSNQVDKWSTREGATSYWVEVKGDRVRIDDAETLFRMAMNGNGTVNVIVRDEAVAADSDPEYGAAVEKRRRRKCHKVCCNRDQGSARGQDHPHSSRHRSRSHSMNSSNREDFQECCGHCHPYYGLPFFVCPTYGRPSSFCPFYPSYCPMSNRVGNPAFFGMGPCRCRVPNGGK